MAEKSVEFEGAVNLGIVVRLATELRLCERRVLTGDYVLIPEDGEGVKLCTCCRRETPPGACGASSGKTMLRDHKWFFRKA